jgi:hypothetical protein
VKSNPCLWGSECLPGALSSRNVTWLIAFGLPLAGFFTNLSVLRAADEVSQGLQNPAGHQRDRHLFIYVCPARGMVRMLDFMHVCANNLRVRLVAMHLLARGQAECLLRVRANRLPRYCLESTVRSSPWCLAEWACQQQTASALAVHV